MKRLAPGIGGDGGKPLRAGLVILSKRIDHGIRGAQAREQARVARAARGDGGGVGQRLNVMMQAVQHGKQIPLRLENKNGSGRRHVANDKRRGACAGWMVAPRAIFFYPVVTANDVAPGIVNGECNALAVKEADEIFRVQPFDKLGRVATPLGKIGAMFRRQRGDARLPVERRLRGRRRIGTRRRRGRRRDIGKADVFAAGVGVAQAAMLGEKVNGITLAATGKTFPAFLTIVADVEAETGR